MTKNIQIEDIWITKKMYEDAETAHYETLTKAALTPLAGEVAKARQRLIESRKTFTARNVPSVDHGALKFFEKKFLEFGKTIDIILKRLDVLESQVESITMAANQTKPMHEINIAAARHVAVKDDDEEDDGVDLFASESEEEESAAAAKIREDRLKAYEAKKAKKPVLIAKSNVILDVKPWDDETDMEKMEKEVRKIETDGLLWGAAKFVPLAYGIHKLQISCVVEDEKVSIDWLTEKLQKLEEYVQSVDIAAFNKI